jgi:hypothetical protein
MSLTRPFLRIAPMVIAMALVAGAPATAQEPSELERNLTVTVDGVAKTLTLEKDHGRNTLPGCVPLEIRGGGWRDAPRRSQTA